MSKNLNKMAVKDAKVYKKLSDHIHETLLVDKNYGNLVNKEIEKLYTSTPKAGITPVQKVAVVCIVAGALHMTGLDEVLLEKAKIQNRKLKLWLAK